MPFPTLSEHQSFPSFSPSSPSMAATPPDVTHPLPEDLLHYLPKYQVILCTTCLYAIQPTAIARHLKEIHHILRSHRRPFMAYVSGLELADHEKVISIIPEVFPVPLLPVRNGYQCGHDGCQHLCVTDKRMKAHWVMAHARHGVTNVDFHGAPLQTFFKGNLLQYFTGTIRTPLTPESEPDMDHVTSNLARSRLVPDGIGSPESLNGDTSYIFPQSKLPLNYFPPSAPVDTSTTNDDDTETVLLRHYHNATSLSFASNDNTAGMWQQTVPDLCHEHKFLHHAILAVTAMHLAYLYPSRRNEYHVLGTTHQDIAMPLFRTVVAEISSSNCNAILIFTHLLVIYSFASETEDEKLIMAPEENEGLPSWLYYLREGCNMLSKVWYSIASGPIAPLSSAWQSTGLDISKLPPPPLLDYFLSVPQSGWSSAVRTTYAVAALELARAFKVIDSVGDEVSTWDVIRIWPMRKISAYMELLREWHPAALLLLAHYAIILKKVDGYWYFEGQAARLLRTARGRLSEEWWPYIEWPMRDVGIEVIEGSMMGI